jgi:ATP-dependent DNA helicase RecG
MFDITTRDIKYLQGVGPQRATVLNKELNLFSLHDLLYYFPYKYVDRSRLYYIHEIDGNMPYIQLKGEILSFETLGEGRQRRLVGHFSDGTGIIDLVWFQGIKYLLEHYKTRTEYIVFGKPTVFNGRINVAHPDMDPSGELTLSTMGLQPYYNTTERMKRGFLNSHGLEKLMKNALALLQEPLAETLPPRLVEEHHLMSLDEAIRNIHFPKNPELLRKAQYRLKFEELFYVQLNILRYSKDRQRKYRGLRFERVGEIFNTFYSQNLPFELTGAQKRVIKEIRKVMEQECLSASCAGHDGYPYSPTSITVVATIIWVSPLTKRCISASFSAGFILPCTLLTWQSGNSAQISSYPSSRFLISIFSLSFIKG